MTTFRNDTARLKFRTVNAIIQRFREQDPDAPIQQALIFCWVALNEGRSQRDMRDALGIASSTSSRNLAALSSVHRLGKPGLGLIEWIESGEDRRVKMLQLSQKGRTLVHRLLGDL
ncbi:hypothetical protein P775_15045 [Puniceibacterium antarcticum]|uniref:HTH marR-type domain-containing protein n=1 Tax=Puniceibacterium antarcticum TaxID=1206336 RepID=A0A2G8RD03_9RHOB|nr:MarR family winged helix-turn-helix transcriptional regulator [Puniceibacterium antarcticum]PIL19454.1 hypothetical protein P775_15045 [Puniceibacterium antarcticum]